MSCPSQVYRTGMGPPATKAVVERVSGVGVGVAVGIEVGVAVAVAVGTVVGI